MFVCKTKEVEIACLKALKELRDQQDKRDFRSYGLLQESMLKDINWVVSQWKKEEIVLSISEVGTILKFDKTFKYTRILVDGN
jgi:hypothetical protein